MDAEIKHTRLTKDTAKPHYGYYALPLFAILSAIITITGILVAILVWRLAGLIAIGVRTLFHCELRNLNAAFRSDKMFRSS